MPFEQLAPVVQRVARHVGVWSEAIRGVSNWLHFDRREQTDSAQTTKVRALYDALLPTDLIDQTLLFASGSTLDILDPDQDYDESGRGYDFRYSDRVVMALAEQVAVANDNELQRCLKSSGVHETGSTSVCGRICRD